MTCLPARMCVCNTAQTHVRHAPTIGDPQEDTVHLHITAALTVAATVVVSAIVPAARDQSRLVSPEISSMSPASPARSASAQTLTISGRNFSPGMSLEVTSPDGRTLRFAGPAIQSGRETSFQVAVILAVAGGYTLIVTNPDGAASAPFAFKGRASAGKPKIDRVTPGQLTVDSEPQLLTVTGERFVPGLVVYLTDPIGVVYLVKGPAIGPVTATFFEVSVVLEMEGEYTLMVTSPSDESSAEVTLKVSRHRAS